MATVTESAGSVTDRGGYLQEILEVLWPQPARIERSGRALPGAGARPGRTATGGSQTEFLLVPNETRPVLLVPRRPRRATAAALRHYKASAVGGRRLAFRGLAAAAQLGLADVLPHRVTVGPTGDGPEADVVAYLRKVLDQDLVVSLRVGPPRANRKPVLELLSPSGEMLGFAKVGITGLTRKLVRTEATALDVLRAAGLSRLRGAPAAAPRPVAGARGPGADAAERLRADREPGHADLRHGRGGHGCRESPRSWSARAPTGARCAPGWRRCADREPAAALLKVMDDLQATADATSVAFGSWHGDWTPWNMASSDDQLLAWDWERFESGVPIGYDALHHQLQGEVERNGAGGAQSATEAALFTAPMTLGPLGVRPGFAVFVAALYLIEIATRYTCDGAAEAGARLGDVSTWLLPPLARYAERTRG